MGVSISNPTTEDAVNHTAGVYYAQGTYDGNTSSVRGFLIPNDADDALIEGTQQSFDNGYWIIRFQSITDGNYDILVTSNDGNDYERSIDFAAAPGLRRARRARP